MTWLALLLELFLGWWPIFLCLIAIAVIVQELVFRWLARRSAARKVVLK